jgi:hypothetical protein
MMMMKRSRIQAGATFSKLSSLSSLSKRSYKIHVQLDYHPSSQYAGLHLALRDNLYAKHGLQVTLSKPGKHGGDEPKLVVEQQAKLDLLGETDSISIGIVEQNVLIPAISNNLQVMMMMFS